MPARAGSPAKRMRDLSPAEIESVHSSAAHDRELAQGYR